MSGAVSAQILLPQGIRCHIRTIVEHEIELDSVHPRPLQVYELVRPCIRVDPPGVRRIADVTPTGNFRGKERLPDLLFMGGAVLPECLAHVPRFRQSLKMGDGVLNDQDCKYKSSISIVGSDY